MSDATIRSFVCHSLSLPRLSGARCHVFDVEREDPILAVVYGNIAHVASPLVRVHSRCVYGEVLGSLDCDCCAQMRLAFDEIEREGVGLFLYLEQEGRGCGLISKARAYELKETRELDTVAAYKHMGLTIDARTYASAASVIKHFGAQRIRLLTNNPNKVAAIGDHGLEVTHVALRAEPTPHNIDYLRVKQYKLGHDLGLLGPHSREQGLGGR